jgi:hypothetical protein
MLKKITGLLLAGILMCSLIGCNMVSPEASMKPPAIPSQDNNDSANFKGYLPDKAKLLKVSSLTDSQKDSLEADLTGDGVPELILSYVNDKNQVGLLILQKEGKGYTEIYNQTFMNKDNDFPLDELVNIKTARLQGQDLSQLIVSYNYYGADHNSLSVQIIGYDTGEKAVKNYLSLMDIPKASVDVKEDRILVEAMGIYKEYQWDGSKFKGQQVFQQPETKKDDVIVHYAMSEKGPMTVSAQELTLKVGQRLVLVRDDKLSFQERVMQSGDDPGFIDILEYMDKNIYTAQKPGTLTMTIVPNGGYDWDNAQDIKITVQN